VRIALHGCAELAHPGLVVAPLDVGEALAVQPVGRAAGHENSDGKDSSNTARKSDH
jgi:hypothetical protein